MQDCYFLDPYHLPLPNYVLLLLFSHSVGLFATPRTAAHQASLSLNISWEFAQVHIRCIDALLWQRGLHN